MSKIAIISDVHGNLEALNAVMDDIRYNKKADKIWNLGDTIDYGPDSKECFNMCEIYCEVMLAGNHEGCLSEHCRKSMTPHGAISAKITRSQLKYETLDKISKLKPSAHRRFLNSYEFHMYHAGPADYYWKAMTAYDLDKIDLNLDLKNIILVGHTHKPEIQRCGNIAIINPGSVGQPRDGDPRASYILIDIDEVGWYAGIERVEYDIEYTQNKMRAKNYPQYLIDRLSKGC